MVWRTIEDIQQGFKAGFVLAYSYMYMLPTDLQPLDRFKAVRLVSKPSLSTYVYMYVHLLECMPRLDYVVYARVTWCNIYDTASCREACGVVVYRECFLCMFFQGDFNHRSCTRVGDNICLLFVPPASIKMYVEV